jgi:hypothetical protein
MGGLAPVQEKGVSPVWPRWCRNMCSFLVKVFQQSEQE